MTALRVRLSIGLLVEEIDNTGRQVAEPVNQVKTTVARFSDQADLEQYLPAMLDRLGDEVRDLAAVHPRRGTQQEIQRARVEHHLTGADKDRRTNPLKIARTPREEHP